MAHLAPETFVDLVDGTRADASEPHLATCAECRLQLAELRALTVEVSTVDVPEPSPLFWNHLSARVRDAVEAEPRGVAAWFHGWNWRTATVAGAAAVVLLAAALVVRDIGPASPRAGDAAPPTVVETTVASEPLADDEPFGLVADLAGDLDWESAVEATLPARGGIERAVADLTEPERAELQRLLTDALEERSGV